MSSAQRELLALLSALLALHCTVTAALPINGPIGGGPTQPPFTFNPAIQGTLTYVNCFPSAQPSVRIGSSTVLTTGGLAGRDASHNLVLSYFKQYDATTTQITAPTTSLGPHVITPPSSPCTGVNWAPTTRTATAPASGQNFVLLRGTPISMGLLATALTGYLRSSGVSLLLNNFDPSTNGYKSTSVFRLGTMTLPITIPKVSKSLDVNLYFGSVHIGTADFYVQSMSMTSINFAAAGNAFTMTIAFESASKEIKGFLRAGNIDSLIPDFEVNNAQITVTARPIVTGAGAGLTLQFSNAALHADIQATGGCSYTGADICNALFGTSGMIQSAIENAVNNVLGAASIQDLLAGAIKTFLQSVGVTRNIASFGVYNGQLYYVLALPPIPGSINVHLPLPVVLNPVGRR